MMIIEGLQKVQRQLNVTVSASGDMPTGVVLADIQSSRHLM